MIKGIGHIGIVVKDIEKSLAAISKVCDIPIPQIRHDPKTNLKFAMVDLEAVGLEFIQDCSDDGELMRFVKERGDAIHHFCLLTDEIEADIEMLKNRGVEMADQKPRFGIRGKKIAFTMPSALNGIPLELSEP